MAVEHDTSAGGAPATTRVTARTARWRRPFVRILLACLGLHVAWALAMPVTSGPDEPAHVYRAISLWQGDLVPSARLPGGEWIVEVPSSVPGYAESSRCFRFRPDVPASCSRLEEATGATTTIGTGAGRYLPPYYYAVGWPGRIDGSVVGFYAMRAVSLVVSAAVLALALVTVVRTIGTRWAALVLPVAVTPQVLWLGSLVNPNAWEVNGGILAWAAGLALVSRLSPERRATLWTRFLLGAGLLLLTRRLSPLWFVLIVGGILAVRLCLPVAQRSSLRSLASSRAVAVMATLAALAALSVWWHATFDLASLDAAPPYPAPAGLVASLAAVAPDIPRWLVETYGVFGWRDTVSPGEAVVTWVLLGGAVLTLVVAASRHRVRVLAAVGLGIVLCVGIPLAMSVTVGRQAGIHFWQGRYTMPLSQGVPLALGVLGAARPRRDQGRLDQVTEWASRGSAWLMWPVLGTLTLVWALHRFTTGEAAGWSLRDLPWSPPGGVVALVALHAVAAAALASAVREKGSASTVPARLEEADGAGAPPARRGRHEEAAAP